MLGLGDSFAEFGENDGRNFLRLNHWESTIPGLAIVFLVLSVSLIGDGLRDVFDPRLRHEAKGVE